MNFFDILQNRIVVTCFLSYLIAQLLKVMLGIIRDRRLDVSLMVAAGGMPSSHSSTVTSAFVMTGLMTGWTSVETAITLIFAIIIMYDATGVRRAAGEQAKVLNEIVELVEHRRMITGKKLKELLGHTPIQVIAGSALGVAVALISYYLF